MKQGTVYTVASGKGGVGKTTVAINIAACLADAGRKTVVVDADLGMANVADHLGLTGDESTIHDVLSGRIDVDAATLDVAANLFAVPGAIDLEAYVDIDPDRLDAVVETLKSSFDYVILDGGAGLSYETAVPLGLADEVVLVTDSTPVAVQDTRKTAQLADRAGSIVAGAVVNRVGDAPTVQPADVAARLGTRHLGTVPESAAVTESLHAAEPVIWHGPHDDAAAALRSITNALTGVDIPTPPDPAVTEPVESDPLEGDSEEDSRGLIARIFGR